MPARLFSRLPLLQAPYLYGAEAAQQHSKPS
jgi:hypothetical protein